MPHRDGEKLDRMVATLVTLWQHGTAESDYDEYGYGRDRPYHWNSDWDEDEEEDYRESDSQYEMGEIFDTSLLAVCRFIRIGRADGRGVAGAALSQVRNSQIRPAGPIFNLQVVGSDSRWH